jgi:hypothetical protein
MEGSDIGLICPCGCENFDRVVVQRKPGPPIVTDFVACVSCRTMFHLPMTEARADPLLERDAAIAAKHYKKPGRR